ncbi:MAG: hypothetical protein AB1515_01530 [Nitrospirota bacterium]
MNKLIFSFIIGLVGLTVTAFAETYWGGELPNIGETTLKTEMALTDGIYTYWYTITSGQTNTGQIWLFDIDITKPEGSVELSSEGLVNGPGYARHSSALILSKPTTPKMIPVGLFSPPNWNSGVSVRGQCGWGANDDQYMIFPGYTLSGFQITSRGLPGLRDFIIEPDIVPPSEEGEITGEQIKATRDNVAFKGKTLGPTAPPAQFVALDFLSYLIELKHQAGTLGWITNKGAENSLDVKLDQVKKKLEAGEPKAAANVLAAFLNEVNAQGCATHDGCPSGKHLRPEAWALLKFNAEYLRSQL